MRRRTVSLFVLISFLLILGTFVHKTMVTVNSSSSTATIYVDPQTSVGAIGQNFTTRINISNVIDLYGWEFRLGWNATILDAVDVREGPFLKSGGDTFFAYEMNNTAGYVLVDCTRLGSIPGVSGNGTLATVEFHVKIIGECSLDLYDTILVNSFTQLIDHTTIDGYYYTSVRDVAIINLVASQSNVDIVVENQGIDTETFNVSTYYTYLADPLIGTQTITLESGTNTTLTFTWKPTNYGKYEIRAEASKVPGEVDTEDNIRVTFVFVRQLSVQCNLDSEENQGNFYMIYFILSFFAMVIIPDLLRKKNAQTEILTTNLRQRRGNHVNHPLNEWIRRQPI